VLLTNLGLFVRKHFKLNFMEKIKFEHCSGPVIFLALLTVIQMFLFHILSVSL